MKAARKTKQSVHFLKQFAFLVAIDRMTSTRFSFVSAVPLAGASPGETITLRRGLTDASEQELERWAITGGARQIVIGALDRAHNVRRRINIGTWVPASYHLGPWDNSSDNVVMEEITLRKVA